ncbi:MAG: CDP-glycerol glycerophosphotransferase family protein [Rubrivivax sp.]
MSPARPVTAAAAAAAAAPAPSTHHRLEALQMQRDFDALSRRMRKRPLVLFFGREAFSDNTKYLYLRALAEPRGYEVAWCTPHAAMARQLQAQGLPCLLLTQADQNAVIATLLDAAVAVFTMNPLESVGQVMPLLGCLAGAQQVQLWHGISVKRLNLQLLRHLPAGNGDLRQYWLANARADHVLSTASAFDAYWREVFGCRSLLRAGQPRNEVLVRPAEGLEWLGSELPPRSEAVLAAGAPAVLVVPTWQRGKATELSDGDFLVRALHFARETGVQVFYKAHPAYASQWNMNKDEVDGLHFIGPGVDLYPLLPRFSALVTDYSSILFDFLLTGAPVLTLDLQPGEHHSFEPDWSLVPPGLARRGFRGDGFGPALADVLCDDADRAARAAYARQIFETDPAAACAQLLQVIDRLVERSQQPDHAVWLPAA